jgi:hypothetical protein
MKIDALEKQIIAILTPQPAFDVDSVEQVGYEIMKHLSAAQNLCQALPNSANLSKQIESLKGLVSTYVPINPVLEKDKIDESVIYRLDKQDPINQSEIRVLGGAGRLTMAGLKRKAARETAQLAEDVSADHADWHGAAHNVKQLSNTLMTIKTGLDELASLGYNSLNEQHVQHDVLKAVGMLRNELVKYGRTGKPLTDTAVNKIMQNVLQQSGHTDMNSLLQTWKSSKAGLTPLQWARQSPDIHDKNVHNTQINAPIDESIKNYCVMEMYETMRVGLGEKAWVSISKRLKSQGVDNNLVNEMIDRAIQLSQS